MQCNLKHLRTLEQIETSFQKLDAVQEDINIQFARERQRGFHQQPIKRSQRHRFWEFIEPETYYY